MRNNITNVNKTYLFLSSECPDEHTCGVLQRCVTQGKNPSYIYQNEIWLCTIHAHIPVSFGRKSS